MLSAARGAGSRGRKRRPRQSPQPLQACACTLALPLRYSAQTIACGSKEEEKLLNPRTDEIP